MLIARYNIFKACFITCILYGIRLFQQHLILLKLDTPYDQSVKSTVSLHMTYFSLQFCIPFTVVQNLVNIPLMCPKPLFCTFVTSKCLVLLTEFNVPKLIFLQSNYDHLAHPVNITHYRTIYKYISLLYMYTHLLH